MCIRDRQSIKCVFEWLHDITTKTKINGFLKKILSPLVPASRPLRRHLKKFQKMMILAFEANKMAFFPRFSSLWYSGKHVYIIQLHTYYSPIPVCLFRERGRRKEDVVTTVASKPFGSQFQGLCRRINITITGRSLCVLTCWINFFWVGGNIKVRVYYVRT